MATAHRVIPAVTWGSLPEELRSRWNQLGCDTAVKNVARQQARGEPGGSEQPAPRKPMPTRTARRDWRSSAVGASQGAGGSSECLSMQFEHGVKVGQSWGSLTLHGQQRWTRLGCDQLVN